MKKLKLLWLPICACMLLSCESQKDPININPSSTDRTTELGGPEPSMCMMLVKFTDDNYREYILAEQIGDYPVQMRGTTPPVVEELIVGTIPYEKKLSNGYWLVNWRWGDTFIYKPSNVLLPYKWETLMHWNQTWDMPENPLSFSDCIAELGFVPRRSIDTNLGLNMDVSRYSEYGLMLYDLPYVYAKGYMSEKDIPDEVRDVYFNYIHQQDSLHDVYTDRLIDIINNGSFDNVYKKQL